MGLELDRLLVSGDGVLLGTFGRTRCPTPLPRTTPGKLCLGKPVKSRGLRLNTGHADYKVAIGDMPFARNRPSGLWSSMH